MTSRVVAIPLQFSREQAAEYLGISLATLGRLMKNRLIEFVRVSPRRIYFLERHLQAYQERNTQTCVENSTSARSEITGSQSERAQTTGAARFTKKLRAEAGKRDALVSALQTLPKPRGASPTGTHTT